MQDHPYRQPDVDAGALALDATSADPEATIIYAMLFVLGITRLAVTLALGKPFAAEATVAAALVIAGVLGFAHDLKTRAPARV